MHHTRVLHHADVPDIPATAAGPYRGPRGRLRASALAFAAPATAHPHVWVNVEATVVVENGTITALQQKWLFDEFYTAQAVQGLDTNKDGKFDREELKELTEVNMEGLKEFDYFSFARLAGKELVFDTARDAYLEVVELSAPPPSTEYGSSTAKAPPAKDARTDKGGPAPSLQNSLSEWWSGQTKAGAAAKAKVLALNFTLPLKQPVLTEAQGFEFSVQDPSYFIMFDFGPKDTIRLSDGAPAGCKVAVRDAADLQQLGAALSSQGLLGAGIGKTVTVTCPKL